MLLRKFSVKPTFGLLVLPCGKSLCFQKENPISKWKTGTYVVKDAIKGANQKHLTRPQDCPIEVYKVMLRGWRDDPTERATFEELDESLLLCQQL